MTVYVVTYEENEIPALNDDIVTVIDSVWDDKTDAETQRDKLKKTYPLGATVTPFEMNKEHGDW